MHGVLRIYLNNLIFDDIEE